MTHRILIVEDQADIRKLIRMTLEFSDFELHEAADGETGLEQARTVRPHLMLLDVMMPGRLDGFQVCRSIKADPDMRSTLVVMLTARGQSSDVSAGEQSGADAYLVKPFSPLELIDRVEAMVAQIPSD
ncbi:response regulator transcription factor [Sphaerotilus mobilis]|uniref:Response regulator receiver domain-containing protein n=1 Tax=Sphaerotilus mobilis TaxID=47994 RepID=A0A4Q7LDL0_9BURK|nr:response regulator [Sphaerotilus mobilis]RZS52011.1 response regulator receiver domain-containing protein [Sphaerotilus mobilis]